MAPTIIPYSIVQTGFSPSRFSGGNPTKPVASGYQTRSPINGIIGARLRCRVLGAVGPTGGPPAPTFGTALYNAPVAVV